MCNGSSKLIVKVSLLFWPYTRCETHPQCSYTKMTYFISDNMKAHYTIMLACFHGYERAGFTLSRALFRKNVGPFNWGSRPYFSWGKILAIFLVITVCVLCQLSVLLKYWRPFFCSSLAVHTGIAHFYGIQKFATPFVAALFGRTCWTWLNLPLAMKLLH